MKAMSISSIIHTDFYETMEDARENILLTS